MYPAKYWANFLTLPAKKQVFVAMPFSSEFQHRYDEVIKPAIDSLNFPLHMIRKNGRYYPKMTIQNIGLIELPQRCRPVNYTA